MDRFGHDQIPTDAKIVMFRIQTWLFDRISTYSAWFGVEESNNHVFHSKTFVFIQNLDLDHKNIKRYMKINPMLLEPISFDLWMIRTNMEEPFNCVVTCIESPLCGNMETLLWSLSLWIYIYIYIYIIACFLVRRFCPSEIEMFCLLYL